MIHSVYNFTLSVCRPQTDRSITDTSTLTGCMRGCWTSSAQPSPSPLYQTSRSQVSVWLCDKQLNIYWWRDENKVLSLYLFCLFQGDLRKNLLKCVWSGCRAGWQGCAGTRLFLAAKYSRLSSPTRMRRCAVLPPLPLPSDWSQNDLCFLRLYNPWFPQKLGLCVK